MAPIAYRPRTQTRWIILHDSHTGPGVVNIEQWLAARGRERGLLEIGYHYLILRDGNVARTREAGSQGSHARGYNTDSVGICIAGDGDYNAAQLQALPQLVRMVASLHNYEVALVGHTELPRYAARHAEDPCPRGLDMAELRKRTGLGSKPPAITVEQSPAQSTILLDALRAGKTLTNKTALNCYGVQSLTSRVAELRKQGFPIEGTWAEDRFGLKYMEYRMGGEEPAQ